MTERCTYYLNSRFEDSKLVEFKNAAGDSVELNYVARYKATGAATAGKADGTAVYSIQYQ